MIKLNLDESILLMLTKNAEFIDKPTLSQPMETNYPNPNVMTNFPFFLEHFTIYQNDIEFFPYFEIEHFYEMAIGDILFKVDPKLFQKQVYEFSSNLSDTRGINKLSLLETFVYATRFLEMKNIELSSEMNTVLKGKFIKENEHD